MKVISFFLCSRVVQSFPGNGFDIYSYWGENQKVPSLPINTTLVAFLHLVFEESELGDHVLTVKVSGPNKNTLSKADVPVTMKKANQEFVGPVVLGPMTIENTGNYRLILESDGIYKTDRTVVVDLLDRS